MSLATADVVAAPVVRRGGARTLAGRTLPVGLRSQPLVALLAATSSGIVLDRFASWSVGGWWSVAVLSVIAWWVLARWQAVRVALGALLIASGALGAAWHHACWHLYDATDLGLRAADEPTPVCLEAIATSAPERLPARRRDPLDPLPRGDRTRLALHAVAVRDGQSWQSASGRVTLTVEGHLLGVGAGDRLRIVGQFARPGAPLNPGQFDYRWHLRAERQLCRVWADSPACVQRLERGSSWGLSRAIDRLRSAGEACLWEHLDPARAALAGALLLGSREQLDDERTEAYFVTGLVHVLSISGLHIGILACALFGLLRLGWVRRETALVGVALLTLLYAVLIRAEPPAVRATVVVLLACGALLLGRPALGLNLLAAAALVVLACNPADVFRAGPQLSFLCTLVLLALAERRQQQHVQVDPLEQLLAAATPWPVRLLRRAGRGVGEALWLSTGVWLVSLPLVMIHFHLVSPISLLLTPLTALPATAALLCGFLTLVCGGLLPPLAQVTGWCCDRCLLLVDAAVAWGATIPGGHWWTVGPPGWWVAGSYALAFVLWRGVTWRGRSASLRRSAIAALLLWCAVGYAATGRVRPREATLTATCLAVGHGCAVVMELPEGRTVLYDAGRLGTPAGAANTIAGFLWSRGIGRLDAIVVSHLDVDHYNAVPELLDRFAVGEVIVTPPMLVAAGNEATHTLFAAIRRARVPLRAIAAGDELGLDRSCRLSVLHPPHAGVGGSDNANSLVLTVEHAGRRLLLPGDLERPGLDLLLASEPFDSDVVLAPHHGSVRSDPPGFARWATPRWVVISGAAGRDHDAVDRAYQHGGAQVLHTARDGAVTMTFDAEGVRMVPFHTKVR